MKEIETLNIDKLRITLQRKSIKNMYLKVKPTGEIIVTAPNYIPTVEVIQFVKQKKSWMIHKQKEFCQLPNEIENLNDPEILQMGNLTITVQRKSIKNMYLKVKPSSQIILTAPTHIQSAQMIQFIKLKQAWIDQKQKEFSQIPIQAETLTPSEILKVGELTVKVERKRIKNMYLKVKSTGEIIVSAHPEIDSTQILEFLKTKQSWLEQKQAKFQKLPSQNLKEDEVLFLGTPLKCIQKWGEKFEVEIKDHQLFVYTPKRYSYEEMIQRLEPWFLKQLQDKVGVYYKKYWPHFAKLGFQPVQIKYRQMKSTWGVCRPTRGTITFSKQLIHQPLSFIEYVVVHELCHLLHPNHSAQFYEAVSVLLPQWEEAVKKKV